MQNNGCAREPLTFDGRGAGYLENIYPASIIALKIIIHAHDRCRKKFTRKKKSEPKKCVVNGEKSITHTHVREKNLRVHEKVKKFGHVPKLTPPLPHKSNAPPLTKSCLLGERQPRRLIFRISHFGITVTVLLYTQLEQVNRVLKPIDVLNRS